MSPSLLRNRRKKGFSRVIIFVISNDLDLVDESTNFPHIDSIIESEEITV